MKARRPDGPGVPLGNGALRGRALLRHRAHYTGMRGGFMVGHPIGTEVGKEADFSRAYLEREGGP